MKPSEVNFCANWSRRKVEAMLAEAGQGREYQGAGSGAVARHSGIAPWIGRS